MMHLPDDVAIRISDHNGVRLSLLYSLWGDWITAVGDPDRPDEIFNCRLDAADCFQCANFNLLHGFYRAALAELRVALELLMIGAYGSLNPTDAKYIEWKMGLAELGFTRCRKHLLGTLDMRSPRGFLKTAGSSQRPTKSYATIPIRVRTPAMALCGRAMDPSTETNPSS